MPDQVFSIIYLAGFIVAAIVRVTYTRDQKQYKIEREKVLPLDVILLVFTALGIFFPILYILLGLFPFADFNMPLPVSIIGVLIFFFALWLFYRSHADLGRNWTATPQILEGHKLVTSGIYSRIRHPMYGAHILWAIGQALLVHNWVAGPMMLIFMVPFYLYRAPIEERLLIEKFGDEYRSYMKHTGRLLPGRRQS